MAEAPRVLEGKEFRALWRTLRPGDRRAVAGLAIRGETDDDPAWAAIVAGYSQRTISAHRRNRWWMWPLIVVDGGLAIWATASGTDLPLIEEGWIGIAPWGVLVGILLVWERRWIPRLRRSIGRSEVILEEAGHEAAEG